MNQKPQFIVTKLSIETITNKSSSSFYGKEKRMLTFNIKTLYHSDHTGNILKIVTLLFIANSIFKNKDYIVDTKIVHLDYITETESLDIENQCILYKQKMIDFKIECEQTLMNKSLFNPGDTVYFSDFYSSKKDHSKPYNTYKGKVVKIKESTPFPVMVRIYISKNVSMIKYFSLNGVAECTGKEVVSLSKVPYEVQINWKINP